MYPPVTHNCRTLYCKNPFSSLVELFEVAEVAIVLFLELEYVPDKTNPLIGFVDAPKEYEVPPNVMVCSGVTTGVVTMVKPLGVRNDSPFALP